jgi:hypothetical protein
VFLQLIDWQMSRQAGARILIICIDFISPFLISDFIFGISIQAMLI